MSSKQRNRCGPWFLVPGPSFPADKGQGTKDKGQIRAGLTLVELLVVIAVLATVTVASIPIVLPALDSRRVRESARILSTQLAAAQTLAISEGRPAGLWIERLAADRTGAIDLYLCQSPEPYSGDTLSSVINVQHTSGTPQACQVTFDTAADASWRPSRVTNIGPLRPGDLIQLDHRGAWYRFPGNTPSHTGGATNTTVTGADGVDYLDTSASKQIEPTSPNDYDASGNPLFPTLPPRANVATFNPTPFPHPPNDVGWYVPYRIIRQPTKLATGSVSLPTGAVLDTFHSGQGSGQWGGPLPGTSPVLIVFNATGALDSMQLPGAAPLPVTQPLHLLIGKREKLNGTAKNDGERNLYDLESMWVTTNPQTGLVTTAEMASIPSVDYSKPDQIVFNANHVAPARQFATSAQTMGGK